MDEGLYELQKLLMKILSMNQPKYIGKQNKIP